MTDKQLTHQEIPKKGITSDIYSIVTFFSLLSLFFLQGCYYDVIIVEELDSSVKQSFSADIVPIFQTSCISCHDGVISVPNLSKNHAYSALLDGNYVTVGKSDESVIVEKLQGGHPFDGAVTDTEMAKLLLWIDAGANDN